MITDELDINIVKRIVTDYFKADFELERATAGVSTYVYSIQHKGQKYYLRILPEDLSFAAEATAHEALLKLDVRVPRPLYYEHKNGLIGKSLMLTTEIPGCCVCGDKQDVSSVLFEAGK